MLTPPRFIPPLRWLVLILILGAVLPAQAKRRVQRTVLPPAGPFTTVVIDAGHGGHDVGGMRGQRVLEKVVALDVAQRLRKELDRAGFRTIMTRNSDVFVSLDQRVAIANAHRDAIFVSVHFNAAPRVGARGVETFYATPNSRPIAAHILRQLTSLPLTGNRGVKHAEFYVLRRNSVRATLTECGFLTNPDDTALAIKATYRQRLAESMATAIQHYRASL